MHEPRARTEQVHTIVEGFAQGWSRAFSSRANVYQYFPTVILQTHHRCPWRVWRWLDLQLDGCLFFPYEHSCNLKTYHACMYYSVPLGTPVSCLLFHTCQRNLYKSVWRSRLSNNHIMGCSWYLRTIVFLRKSISYAISIHIERRGEIIQAQGLCSKSLG